MIEVRQLIEALGKARLAWPDYDQVQVNGVGNLAICDADNRWVGYIDLMDGKVYGFNGDGPDDTD